MKKLLATTIAASSVFVSAAIAETSPQELSAIKKIASLCKTFQTLQVAIVKSGSEDPNKLKQLAESTGLKTELVDFSNLSNTGANMIFLPEGMSKGEHEKVKNMFQNKKVITVSTDLTCVETGNCMIGVNVGSVVKLLVNSSIYESSGLKFDPAFEFMVKQI